MILENNYPQNTIQVLSLTEAKNFRIEHSKTKTDYLRLSFWDYVSYDKRKEICIDSFNSDDELNDDNIFTENEEEAEFCFFDWTTGERHDGKGKKLKDKKKNEPPAEGSVSAAGVTKRARRVK